MRETMNLWFGFGEKFPQAAKDRRKKVRKEIFY